jgi:hypothetical protein
MMIMTFNSILLYGSPKMSPPLKVSSPVSGVAPDTLEMDALRRYGMNLILAAGVSQTGSVRLACNSKAIRSCTLTAEPRIRSLVTLFHIRCERSGTEGFPRVVCSVFHCAIIPPFDHANLSVPPGQAVRYQTLGL